MTTLRYDLYWSLRGTRTTGDLDRALRAEVHDPAWFLARQWMLGEHQGSDRGVLVQTSFRRETHPLEAVDGRDLDKTPIEAVVETDADEFWTPGRRVRLGMAYARAADGPGGRWRRLLAFDLPSPYARFNGRVIDGRQAHAFDPGHAVFADVPTPRREHYRPANFDHAMTAGIQPGGSLDVHSTGARLHWHDADLDAAVGPGILSDPTSTRLEPLRFPAMPNPRYWQVEDTTIDPSRYGADSGHFASLILFELIAGVAHEWYGFVWRDQAGALTAVQGVEAHDVFGRRFDVHPPRPNWHVFRLHNGRQPRLLSWVHAERPVLGELIEQVQLTVDEQTGIVWAREQRVDGRDVATPPLEDPEPTAEVVHQADEPQRLYEPVRGFRADHHPYLPTDAYPGHRLEQGVLADLSESNPRFSPLPATQMLGAGQPHHIDPGVVFGRALTLTRRWVLARDVDGNPVLWIRRASGPAATRLPIQVRFDQIEVRS